MSLWKLLYKSKGLREKVGFVLSSEQNYPGEWVIVGTVVRGDPATEALSLNHHNQSVCAGQWLPSKSASPIWRQCMVFENSTLTGNFLKRFGSSGLLTNQHLQIWQQAPLTPAASNFLSLGTVSGLAVGPLAVWCGGSTMDRR